MLLNNLFLKIQTSRHHLIKGDNVQNHIYFRKEFFQPRQEFPFNTCKSFTFEGFELFFKYVECELLGKTSTNFYTFFSKFKHIYSMEDIYECFLICHFFNFREDYIIDRILTVPEIPIDYYSSSEYEHANRHILNAKVDALLDKVIYYIDNENRLIRNSNVERRVFLTANDIDCLLGKKINKRILDTFYETTGLNFDDVERLNNKNFYIYGSFIISVLNRECTFNNVNIHIDDKRQISDFLDVVNKVEIEKVSNFVFNLTSAPLKTPIQISSNSLVDITPSSIMYHISVPKSVRVLKHTLSCTGKEFKSLITRSCTIKDPQLTVMMNYERFEYLRHSINVKDIFISRVQKWVNLGFHITVKYENNEPIVFLPYEKIEDVSDDLLEFKFLFFKN